jgi:hypothetical protein
MFNRSVKQQSRLPETPIKLNELSNEAMGTASGGFEPVANVETALAVQSFQPFSSLRLGQGTAAGCWGWKMPADLTVSVR